MHCCFTKGISPWLKNATVINHHQCETKSLLVPAFCHHQFNSFPASSSFPLWSAPRNWFSLLLHISLLTSLWAVHAQTLSDPFLLAWSLPLCPALQLLCCLVSGPAVNIQSAHFHPPASSCNYFTPPCSTNTLHFSSPIICCRGERVYGGSMGAIQVLGPSLSGGCLGRSVSREVHPFEHQSSPSSLRQ